MIIFELIPWCTTVLINLWEDTINVIKKLSTADPVPTSNVRDQSHINVDRISYLSQPSKDYSLPSLL